MNLGRGMYPNYAHAFFNQDISDAFEDVTIKTYQFVEAIFQVKTSNE
ncbi:MAG: hypothetical protein ABJN84_08840 [Flavobacteriaceae bacterium]